MDVIKAIKTRKSIRSFKKKLKIQLAEIKKILELASLSQVAVTHNLGMFMFYMERV